MRKPKIPQPLPMPDQPSGTRWQFVIRGVPFTKKNSKRAFVNKTTGRAFIANGGNSRKWEADAAGQLLAQWHRRPLAIGQPVRMTAVIYRERATGDLLNYLAAVSDALEKARVIVNDRQVVSLDGSRLDKDAENPRVVVDVIVI